MVNNVLWISTEQEVHEDILAGECLDIYECKIKHSLHGRKYLD